ncbi:MAG: hypothetical protein HYR55_14265 [Acidobacteria bacterium]|nr:hypothetical protein [Acidobacteriota bacterium]MBI3658636.1 hypothetical protein [Acidobacteriota bacterium]
MTSKCRPTIVLIQFLIVFFFSFLTAQTISTTAPTPELWLVQFEKVDAGMTTQYEEKTRVWREALLHAKAGAEWTYYLSGIRNFTYMMAIPQKSFAALDQKGERATQLKDSARSSNIDQLQKEKDTTISTRRSEVWRFREDLTYRPKGVSQLVPGYQRMTVEWIKPGKLEKYFQTSKQTRAALAKVNYSLGYMAFSVVYGDGSIVYLWEADTAERFYKDYNIGPALIQALGSENATKLYMDWLDCVTKVDYIEGYPRTDLSYTPEPAPPWLSHFAVR